MRRPPIESTRRAIALLLACAAGAAGAQNADGVLLGSEAAVTGGAVLATTRDAAGAFYNPAGLGALEGTSVQVSASAYEASTVRLPGFVTTTLPWAQLEETVRTSTVYMIPSVAAFGVRLRGGIGVAAGAWVPTHREAAFTSDVQSSGPWTPGGLVTRADYRQTLSFTQRLQRTHFGAAAGLALHPRLRAGLAAFLAYDRAEEFLSLVASIATDSPVPEERGGTLTFAASGAPVQLAARLSAGLQWDVGPSLTLALGARTPSLPLARRGSFSTASTGAVLFPGIEPILYSAVSSAAPTRLEEPWRLAAGASTLVRRWSLRAEADWQASGGGRRGVWNGRLGALRDGGDLRVGAGVFTDRARERPSPGELVADFYGVAAGVDYRPPLVRAARGDGGWDVRTSIAVRYALGVGEVTGIALDPFGLGAAPPAARATRLHAVSVSVGGLARF